MKRNEQQAIEELARLLDGDVRVDGVGRRVRELASLATAVRDEIEAPRPTPAFKAALRTQLLDDLAVAEVSVLDRVRDAVSQRTARWRYSARVALASATASTMLGTAGVAVAAQQALPGELLYPVKEATETVRMGFARGYVETGRLHLTFAAERLEELGDGLANYDPDTVIDLLGEMDQETLAGTDDLLQAYDESGNELILIVLERFAEQQRTGLSAIFDQLPSEASPFVDRSFEILRRLEVTLTNIQHGCAVCGSDAAGADTAARTTTVNAPGEGPAVQAECDCETFLPSALRDGTSTTDQLRGAFGDDDEGDGGESDGGDWDGDLSVTIPSLPAPLDSVTRTIAEALFSLGGNGTVTETVEQPAGTIDGTTDSTTGTVADPTEATTGGDGTTDAVDDTANTTGATEDATAPNVSGTLDELLDGAEDTITP